MKTTASSTSLNVLGRAQIRKAVNLKPFPFLTRAPFRHVLTGSYHNYFRIFDVESLSDVVLQADKSAFKAKKIGGPLPGNKPGAKNGTRGLRDAMQMETLDFNKKILHASWHPRESTIAVCLVSSLRCGWIADIYLDFADCCNKQPVLIQCRVMSAVVLVGSIVQLCVVACRQPSVRRGVCLFVPSVLQYISWSLLFTSLTLRHLTSPLLPVTHPLPLVPVQPFLLRSYLNAAHTPLKDLRSRPFLVSWPLTILTLSPLPLRVLTPHPPTSPSAEPIGWPDKKLEREELQ